MLNNNSNRSLLPYETADRVFPSRFSLYLAIIIGVSSLVGTIFSIIDLRRFFRRSDLRNHFNYIYHSMLVFCLWNSLIYIPCFYAGIYLSLFVISPIFCTIFQIHSHAILAGMAYLLMWASLERHQFLFRINTALTLSRQIFPLTIVAIFVYSCSILINLLPKCVKRGTCEACFIQNFVLVILFLIYTFVIPIFIMICSTALLLWRFVEHRRRLNKRRRWIRLRRMFYQSITYLIWYSLAYWPYTIYSLLISYNFNQFDSVLLKNTSYLMNSCGIQVLPILTYFMFRANNKQPQRKYAIADTKDIQINREQKWSMCWFTPAKQAPIVERF